MKGVSGYSSLVIAWKSKQTINFIHELNFQCTIHSENDNDNVQSSVQ